MTDTVDLMVVGVEADIPRAEMSQKLQTAFKQQAYMFEALLDGAYGESAPYAAQSDVQRGLAEEGLEQLEQLGLKCAIVATGEMPDSATVAAAMPAAPAPAADAAADTAGDLEAGSDIDETDDALAAFKSSDNPDGDSNDSGDSAVDNADVAFDTDEIGESDSDSALASFKKMESKDSNDNAESAVDFSDELDSVGVDGEEVSALAKAKSAKNDVAAKDDAINHDFSDQFEDAGSDELSAGLKEAQEAKPDFNAEATDVDFSDDASLIGIHETEEANPANKNRLQEEETERNLASFPKEGADVDFSDDLETLVTGVSPAAESSAVESSDQTDTAEEDAQSAEATAVEAGAPGESIADSKNDVPEALAAGDAGDLQAELIDPAPAAKKEKAPVEADDGGLSLSSDDSAPLTAPKEKADPEKADDGGITLSTDSEAPLTEPRAPANPAAADDGGLTVDDSNDQPAVAEKSEPAAAAPVAEAPAEKKSTVAAPAAADIPAPAVDADVKKAAPDTESADDSAAGGGLVLPGNSVVPSFTPEDELDDVAGSATDSLREELPVASNDAAPAVEPVEPVAAEADSAAVAKPKKKPAKSSSKKTLVAAVAAGAVLVGGGTFAFMNAGSIASINQAVEPEAMVFDPVNDSIRTVEKVKVKVKVKVEDFNPDADLESLSTGELLGNLSDTDNSSGILDLEPYFLESGDLVKRSPRIGAAVPASEWIIGVQNREAHPADAYFDEWSNREADLSLFLALLDSLIEKGDLEVAQQLSDRAKDKLFAVMSSQRLARAYSDAGENAEVSRMMALASRDTFAIKSPEERVLAISDYALTEQAIGLNEDAMDTFLKTTILARSLGRSETRAVGLSSAAINFQLAGRTKQAQELLGESLKAGMELPENTAARDLAIRYISLSEARMGLFNQALKHARTIVDPFATVSAFHGIALAIESTGDNTNARKVLNMAYRAGSLIDNEDERRQLLSKVVLASETE